MIRRMTSFVPSRIRTCRSQTILSIRCFVTAEAAFVTGGTLSIDTLSIKLMAARCSATLSALIRQS
jgi:hypothetical protein